ncbi:MAG: DUF3137 domain-containing protein [Saprospiraceae bacterium]|nr:DUF3137 domain-containing protein [Saprospiraceae bacterium]
MRRLEEFRIYYNHTIHPELVRLERRRRRLLLLVVVSAVLMLAVVVFEIYLQIIAVTLFLMMLIGVYITYLLYLIRQFVITFKPHVVNLILDFIDDGVNYGTLVYKPKQSIAKDKFVASGLFNSPAHVFEGEDYISGKIGELDFEMSELNVREISKVRERLNYVFQGIFLCTRLKESVYGTIYILPRVFRQYLSRSIRYMRKDGNESIDNLIRNKRFRETFLTYASKDAKVRTLLSDAMQHALVDYTELSGKEIYLSFDNHQAYIAITEQKDILEPFVFRSNVSFELVREFFEDIQLLMRIVEDIDANN